jgi:hypothetical protein
MKLGCSKAQSLAWKRPTLHVVKKFRSQPSGGKIKLIIFWDMKGMILVHFIPKGPDLASRDFNIFGPVKEALRERRVSSDEEAFGAVQNRLKTQPKNFSSDGIKKKKTCETLKPVR